MLIPTLPEEAKPALASRLFNTSKILLPLATLSTFYFNLHRNDVDKYSVGNVRTFFGYIETVNKSVTVDGSGAKLTSYTITCLAFDKALKATQIYNNPHLVSQQDGAKTDVVRKDFQNNLGGISLFSKGIATRGTPRDLILRNLMRMLGFGGQFVLPEHYSEVLPDAVRSVEFKEPADTKGKLVFSNAAMAAISKPEQDAIIAAVKDFKGKIKPNGIELNLTTQILKGNISYDALIAGIEKNKYKEFNEAFLATIARFSNKAKRRMTMYMPTFNITNNFANAFVSNTYFKVSTGLTAPAPIGTTTKQSAITGIEGVLKDQLQEVTAEIKAVTALNRPVVFPSVNMWAGPNGEETPAKTIFNILSLDYMEDVDGYYGSFAYIHYSGSLWGACYQNSNSDINEFFCDLRPAANFETAAEDGLGIPLDGAIPMVPAVILREKPFTNYRQPTKVISAPDNTSTIKIGTLSASAVGGGAVGGSAAAFAGAVGLGGLGGLAAGAAAAAAFGGALGNTPGSDQLYMSIIAPTGAKKGFRGLSATAANLEKISGALQNVGLGTVEKQTVTASSFGNLATDRIRLEFSQNHYTLLGSPAGALLSLPKESRFSDVGVHQSLIDPLLKVSATTKTKTQVDQFALDAELELSKLENLSLFSGVNLTEGQFVASGASAKQLKILGYTPTTGARTEVPLEIAEQAFSTVFALPRPVFRSPDGGRVTKENKMGGVQRILGVMAPSDHPKYGDPYSLNFYAFSTDDVSSATVKNMTSSSLLTKAGDKISSVDGNSNLVLGSDSTMASLQSGIVGGKKERVHILEFVKVHSQDVMNESFSRGNHGILNLVELFPTLAGADAQKLYFNDQLPIVTPLSIHRFGLQVSSLTTNFVNPALLGVSNDFWNQKSMIMKWNVLFDMWNQHNHEYLSGSISMRGLPGIRPGYRIDRPELNLSFYVERVSHTWTYPGHLSTQATVTRGQPMAAETVLDYIPPSPNIDANDSPRQNLGRVFEVGKDENGEAYPYAGTFTGEVIKPKSRSDRLKTLSNPFVDTHESLKKKGK